MKRIILRSVAVACVLIASFGSVVMHGALADDNPNAFNRLMKPASERNAPPETDGIHDPTADGTMMLAVAPSFTVKMVPVRAFSGWPPSAGGLLRGSRQVPVQVGGSWGSALLGKS